MATRTKKRPMSDTHKEALAEGRNHARIVGRYLEALEANKPKRGRKRTADTVKKRLAAVADEIKEATGITRLSLLQERRDLEVELASMQAGDARPRRPREGIRQGREVVFDEEEDLLRRVARVRCAARSAEEGRHHPRGLTRSLRRVDIGRHSPDQRPRAETS